MSQENVDVLKRGMECFERRDVETAMELPDPEVEWHPAFTALLGGSGGGRRGVRGVQIASTAALDEERRSHARADAPRLRLSEGLGSEIVPPPNEITQRG